MNHSRKLPSFIIIGAMKSGTTSLHHYLDAHPQISMSKKKEPDFFLERNWGKGLSWYQSCFKNNDMIKGEASPNYSKFPVFKGVPGRIYEVVPRVKIIYIVRDPIKRLISHMAHRMRDAQADAAKMEKSLFHERRLMLLVSKYYYQLEQYLKYFDEEQIVVVTAEKLKENTLTTLGELFQFLEVDASFTHPSYSTLKHTSKGRKVITWQFMHRLFRDKPYYNLLTKTGLFPTREISTPRLSESTVQQLRKEFSEDVSKMESFIGRELNEWTTTKGIHR